MVQHGLPKKLRTKLQSAITRHWFIVGANQRHRSIRLVFTIAELCRKMKFPKNGSVASGDGSSRCPRTLIFGMLPPKWLLNENSLRAYRILKTGRFCHTLMLCIIIDFRYFSSISVSKTSKMGKLMISPSNLVTI